MAVLAADHHAIAALETPYAAARSDVDVMDPLARELLRAANVVDVVRVAAVDHDVARREMRQQRRERLVDDRGGNHQPDGPRRRELPREVGERRRAGRLFPDEVLHGFRGHVVDDATVPAADQPAHHVGAHPAKPDHSKLHA